MFNPAQVFASRLVYAYFISRVTSETSMSFFVFEAYNGRRQHPIRMCRLYESVSYSDTVQVSEQLNLFNIQ